MPLRGLTRRWVLPSNAASAAPELVGNGRGPASLLNRLLNARGLTGEEAVRRFCEPKLTDLHDPALLPGIDVAARRLIEALRADQSIVIYGDYDVDGITATAILFHVLKTVKPDARLRTYVPHRIEEGYGLNCDALRQLKTEGADLVISVDCGITAVASAHTARQIGLDLIITDHHAIAHDDDAHLPQAVALVHPRLPGSRYPFGDLCGAGVAFKLAWHFARLWCNSDRVSRQLQETLLNMLPLAALGTIADVVPLVDENRIIAAFGLRMIKRTSLVGLKALIEASGLMGESIDSEKVGFVLGPRLNACGRMGHAAAAVRMLTDAPPEEAVRIAHQLSEHNKHRQLVERGIYEKAIHLAEDAGMTREDRRIIILADPSWHPGVVGIVCSRLVEKFGRPAVLFQRQNDVCKGSARSIDGYSIHRALLSGERFLLACGGHDMAAGLSLRAEHLEPFIEAVTAHANAHIAADELTPAITIDCDASLGELDFETVKRMQSLSPFGRDNRPPTLRVTGATLTSPPKQIGGNGRHLSLQVRQELPAPPAPADGGGGSRPTQRWLRAIWWNAGSLAADLAAGMRLDLAIQPKLNAFNGAVNVEAELRDVRICEPA